MVLSVGAQQCMRAACRASCLAHRVRSSPPPCASQSSGSPFLTGAGVNVLGLLIRSHFPANIVFAQVDHYIVKLQGLWLASRM